MDTDEEPPDPGPEVEIEVLGVKQLKGITTEMAIFSCRKRIVANVQGDKQTDKKSEEKEQPDDEHRAEKKAERRSSKRRSMRRKDP